MGPGAGPFLHDGCGTVHVAETLSELCCGLRLSYSSPLLPSPMSQVSDLRSQASPRLPYPHGHFPQSVFYTPHPIWHLLPGGLT